MQPYLSRAKRLGSPAVSVEIGAKSQIFLADLAGERRLREVVPILVDKFHTDSDFDELLERSLNALSKINDPEISVLIRAAYPSASDQFKSYTSDLLGTIKYPESEEVILDLLVTETDSEIRTSLCIGLCELFSERGVGVVLREIASGYEDWLVNLEDQLLPVAEVLGIELPDAERWRAARDERNRGQERLFADWKAPSSQVAAERGHGPDALARIEAAGEPRFEVTIPIRRTEPKVGRNDPCRCGSGKKFKKCCGRNG